MTRPAVAVVCAAFDAATDASVEAWRDTVAATGVRVRRAHRPHLTLAAAVADPSEVVDVAARLATRHAPVPLVFDRLGSFGGGGGVLWLGPRPVEALRELQRDAFAALARLAPNAFGRTAEPVHWTPHCTLATRVPPGVLRTLRARPVPPVVATVDALVVIVVGGRGDVARLPLRPVDANGRPPFGATGTP